jgi:hypothetical protein
MQGVLSRLSSIHSLQARFDEARRTSSLASLADDDQTPRSGARAVLGYDTTHDGQVDSVNDGGGWLSARPLELEPPPELPPVADRSALTDWVCYVEDRQWPAPLPQPVEADSSMRGPEVAQSHLLERVSSQAVDPRPLAELLGLKQQALLREDYEAAARLRDAIAAGRAVQQAPLRAELGRLKPTALRKRAIAAGADVARLEAAEDGDKPRQSMIALILELEAIPGAEEEGSYLSSVSATAAVASAMDERTTSVSFAQASAVFPAMPDSDAVADGPAPAVPGGGAETPRTWALSAMLAELDEARGELSQLAEAEHDFAERVVSAGDSAAAVAAAAAAAAAALRRADSTVAASPLDLRLGSPGPQTLAPHPAVSTRRGNVAAAANSLATQVAPRDSPLHDAALGRVQSVASAATDGADGNSVVGEEHDGGKRRTWCSVATDPTHATESSSWAHVARGDDSAAFTASETSQFDVSDFDPVDLADRWAARKPRAKHQHSAADRGASAGAALAAEEAEEAGEILSNFSDDDEAMDALGQLAQGESKVFDQDEAELLRLLAHPMPALDPLAAEEAAERQRRATIALKAQERQDSAHQEASRLRQDEELVRRARKDTGSWCAASPRRNTLTGKHEKTNQG